MERGRNAQRNKIKRTANRDEISGSPGDRGRESWARGRHLPVLAKRTEPMGEAQAAVLAGWAPRGDESGEGGGMRILELFKGTGSIGRAAEALGHEVFSSDIDASFNPDYCVDILDFDCEKVPFVPDVI